MTRRDFITKGAMATAGAAIAANVRSNLGGMHSRYIPNVPQGEYTAADYVQDGLIAMWDGIENAGLGIHDYDAINWTNLVAGSPFSDGIANVDTGFGFGGKYYKPTSHIWTENSCQNVGYESIPWTCFGIQALEADARANIQTEIVANVYEVTSDLADLVCNAPIFLNAGISFYLRTASFPFQSHFAKWPSGKWQPWCSASNLINNLSPLEKRSYSVINDNENRSMTFINGENTSYVSGINYGTTNTMPQYFPLMCGINMTLDVNCIRLYNRVLSQKEREWNVYVDKARFRLP